MNKALIGVVVAVVIIVGAVLLTDNATAPTTETEMEEDTQLTENEENGEMTSPDTATDPEPQTYTVSMTSEGYAPNTLNIRVGDTVTFTNNGTSAIWPASAPHPTHTDYPEFDPKQGIAPGESWSFTFTRAGNWRYHDHLNPTRFGSVTVAE